ncbi:hypothetical protein REPUB_Repub09cG0043000 [Reevesia pubescens]
MAENQKSEPFENQLGESTESTSVRYVGAYGSLLGSNTAPKMEWPELVGVTTNEAERKIKEKMPRTSSIICSGSPRIYTKRDDFNRKKLP